MEVFCDPLSTFDHLSKEYEAVCQKMSIYTHASLLTAALFKITSIWKQSKCSSVADLDQGDVIYPCYREVCLAIRKDENTPIFSKWRAFEGIMHNKASQSDENKYLTFT